MRDALFENNCFPNTVPGYINYFWPVRKVPLMTTKKVICFLFIGHKRSDERHDFNY